MSRWRTLIASAAALVTLAVAIDLVRPLPAWWFAPVEARRVYARDGELLAERALPERGRPDWVDLDEVAPALIDALVASEDRRFGHHPGVDPIAVGRAAWHDLQAGAFVEGGSTLHQQTARLLAGRPGGLPGKLVEAWRALKLGWHLSDDEVLAWYVNRAYFGRGCWGVACAARRTFDESPASLSVSEAATLVGLLPSPERLHPEVHPDASRAARDRVLDRMVAANRLTPELADEARAEPIELRRFVPEGIAPHFVALSLDDDPDRVDVHTTLDAGLQRTVERLVREQLKSLRGREVDHASVLVVHLPTDEVRAWVGSAGFDAPSGQVDGVRAPRSPGSALKPFVYELAFERGDRPSDVLLDVPTRFGTSHGTWTPTNYSGVFHGPVSMRSALGSSLNVPAVRLLDDLGVPVLQQRLVDLGMERARRPASQVGLGLALGDVEVTLEELATAYGALARGGRARPFVRQLGAPRPPARAVLDPAATALVVDVLADPGARVLGFGRYGPLERAYPAAVKTGTSTDWRDNWTVG
ncbi:MAG: transglycosylase domain-containing protein, partial [Myxococcales bacterium]|nr:transglycosylase domain-containing protein [Myxococcales bacterium]